MVSLTAFRFAAAAAVAPAPLLLAMAEAEEAGEGSDPEVERLPVSPAIAERVPRSRPTGSAPRAGRRREAGLI